MRIKVTKQGPYGTTSPMIWELSSYVGSSLEERTNDARGSLEAMEGQITELRRTLSYLIAILAERSLLTLADVAGILITRDKLEK